MIIYCPISSVLLSWQKTNHKKINHSLNSLQNLNQASLKRLSKKWEEFKKRLNLLQIKHNLFNISHKELVKHRYLSLYLGCFNGHRLTSLELGKVKTKNINSNIAKKFTTIKIVWSWSKGSSIKDTIKINRNINYNYQPKGWCLIRSWLIKI